jgi:Flp pilus assembly protein TadG
VWSFASIKTLLRPVGNDARGAVAVEFAMVGFTFFVLLLGAVDVARYQITVQSLHDISAEAARVALVYAGQTAATNSQNGTSTSPLMSGAALKAAVTSPTNLTPFLAPASLTVTSASSLSAGGVPTVTVTASYPFAFFAPLFTGGTQTLSQSAAISY